MGWFWAQSSSNVSSPSIATATENRSNASPPPSCPMHKPSGASSPTSTPPSCPVTSETSPPSCPVTSETSSSSSSSKPIINPLNYMPATLSQERASQQRIYLPTARTTSSIPRGDSNTNWEYPSPQQMYNAMRRKGYSDTPEDAVESMVEVHNFLNEGAWNEIEAWEARFSSGLLDGWKACRRGEEGWKESVISGTWRPREGSAPRLTRLMGRPNDMSPKARLYALIAWAYPGKFSDEPPFDRHDWFVQRTMASGDKKEVRYVIDYYSGPPESTGEPVFYLDVRPAVDGPTSACERLIRSGCDLWFRGTGSRMREDLKQEKLIDALEKAKVEGRA